VIELSSVSGITLDNDEHYTVRLLSVDGGAVLGTLVSRTLVLLASASPSGVMQLYIAGSRHSAAIFIATADATSTVKVTDVTVSRHCRRNHHHHLISAYTVNCYQHFMIC